VHVPIRISYPVTSIKSFSLKKKILSEERIRIEIRMITEKNSQRKKRKKKGVIVLIL